MEPHQESREHRGTWPAPGLPKTFPWGVETSPQLLGVQLMAQSILHHLHPSSAPHRSPLSHPTLPQHKLIFTPAQPHRISERVRLEGSTGLICPLLKHLTAVHGCVQSVLEYLQCGKLHSPSGVPVLSHCSGQKLFFMLRWNFLGINFCLLSSIAGHHQAEPGPGFGSPSLDIDMHS